MVLGTNEFFNSPLDKVGFSLADDFACLNDDQLKVVKGFKGPSLVVAGPGTGKTRTMSVLIGKLLSEGFRMKEVLALTFSDKAAKELRERVFCYFPESFDECWISTFHSFCIRLLREQFHHVGVRPSFKLLTSFKEAILMNETCCCFDSSQFPIFGGSLLKRGFQLEVLTFIALLKSNFVFPAELREVIAQKAISDANILNRIIELTRIYEAYETFREKAGYLDFRDLIALGVRVLQIPVVSKRYSEQFKVVIVDEFQDTDPAQFLLLTLLKGKEQKPRMAVIGDMFQSIYRFRGANPQMMAKNGPFKKRFGARVFSLPQNYRSATKILQAAGRLYECFSGSRKESIGLESKCLKTGFVESFGSDNEVEEARLIARRVASLIIHGDHRRFLPNEIAILVRNNYQIDVIAEALKALQVPFDISGDIKYFRSEEVTVLALLLKVSNISDSRVGEYLPRLFSSPLFSIDPIWAQRILAALRPGDNLLSILRVLMESTCSGFSEAPEKDKPVLGAFIETIDSIVTSEDQLLLPILSKILFAVQKFLAHPASASARNIFHFRNMVGDFAEVVGKFRDKEVMVSDILKDFDALLAYFASTLEADQELERTNGVHIMTVHQSKGLEFPVVVIPGLCEGLFPVELRENLLIGNSGLSMLQMALETHSRQVDFFNPYPSDVIEHLEEERRLLYVAITRAEEGLIFTFPHHIGIEPAGPSPFLTEIGLSGTSEFNEKRPLSLSEIRILLARLNPVERETLLSKLALPISSEGFFQSLESRNFGEAKIDIIGSLDNFVFSANSIKEYIACPRRFFFLNILRIRDPIEESSSFQLLGQAIHACLEAIHEPCGHWSDGKRPTDEELETLWNLRGAPLCYKLSFLERLDADLIARKILSHYRNAIFDLHQISPIDTIGVEKDILVHFRGFRLRGRIDRLVGSSDGVWIIDYKTGSQKSGEETVQLAFGLNDKPLEIQLPLYIIACRTMGYNYVAGLNLYLKPEPYKKRTRNLEPGFLKSAAINLGAGPKWGIHIEKEQFSNFENNLEAILKKIVQDRKFDCKPIAHNEARTCIKKNEKGAPSCEFVSFCQERLEQIRFKIWDF